MLAHRSSGRQKHKNISLQLVYLVDLEVSGNIYRWASDVSQGEGVNVVFQVAE